MPDFDMGARDLNPSTFTDWALSPVSQHIFKILIENIEFQNNVKVIGENYWEGGRERSKKKNYRENLLQTVRQNELIYYHASIQTAIKRIPILAKN